MLDREQAEVLHVEIDRLPEAFRSPVVLCYFEGLTLDEAAVRLRCPAGTLRSRLARAREKLRRALTRRGVVLSGAVLAAALDARSASASVSPHLCDVTARAAIRFAARQTIASTSATLAREVLRTMTIHKLRAAFTTLVFLAAFATGAGYWFHSLDALARSSEGEPPGEPRAQTARTEQRPADSPRPADAMPPAPGRMFVVGRVLDPQGKPVPNATVNVSARRKLLFASPGSEGCFPAPAGHGASDASGRFRFDAARVSSAHHAQFGATALAPGYGVGWADLDPDEDQPSADIRLMPEQVIEGRLFDVHGQPVPGAVVSVSAIWRTLAPTVLAPGSGHREPPGRTTPLVGPRPRRAGLAEAGDDRRRRPLHPARHRPRRVRQAGRLRPEVRPADDRGRHRRPRGRQDPEGGAPAGPDPHRPRDLCRHRPAGRSRRGPRRRGSAGRAESGRAGSVTSRPRPTPKAGSGSASCRAIASMSGPPLPTGNPTSTPPRDLEWPKGATEQTVDLALPRGVVLRGKVTEEGTGQPVADAMVSSPRPPREPPAPEAADGP